VPARRYGTLIVDNWAAHATVNDVTGNVALTKNLRYSVMVGMYDLSGTAVAKLYWKQPTQTGTVIVPSSRLYAN